MYNITVVVNENSPEQLDIFLKSFEEVNKSDLINYKFIVTSTNFIKHYTGCRHELLEPYKNDHRLGFLSKLDEILAYKPDLVVVAYDMILCRKSMADWFISLIKLGDSWEMCGSALTPPKFPLKLCQSTDFLPVMPSCYVTIDAGFYMLNPQTVETDNAEYAIAVMGNDQYDLIDELVLNIRYNKKIVNQLICCNASAYVDNYEDVKNALVNLYYGGIIQSDSWYFLEEYYNRASKLLKHDIEPIFDKRLPKPIIAAKTKERLLAQHMAVSLLNSATNEINITKL